MSSLWSSTCSSSKVEAHPLVVEQGTGEDGISVGKDEHSKEDWNRVYARCMAGEHICTRESFRGDVRPPAVANSFRLEEQQHVFYV